MDMKKAFEAGWRMAAQWAQRDDLIFDIDSPAYQRERDLKLETIEQQEQSDEQRD